MVIFFFSLQFSIALVIFSPMIFDPQCKSGFFLQLLFISSAFTLPIVTIISVITSLVFLIKEKSYKKAFIFSLLPMINILSIIVAFIGAEFS